MRAHAPLVPSPCPTLSFIRPASVVALMAVLPGCAELFPPALSVGPHALRLEPAHALCSEAVERLLRDT